MKTLVVAAACLFAFFVSPAQKTKILPKKYPSLLWEISGKGLSKPSYLFGTMHVSSKMVFHLSDSFYLGLRNADVVALETNMATWQDDFSRYQMSESAYGGFNGEMFSSYRAPGDYLTLRSLQLMPYEKYIELALYSSPSIINNFLYRSYSERSSDFEEDTYLDLHIHQAGKKWGKKVVGVEDFDESMRLMKEAYVDAANEKNKRKNNYEYDTELSYARLEEAYRTGNLDLLDTINKVNSVSAAFDEKFLYRRNEIQANSIDSILRSKSTLFVGVGAAHLPGQRGVIELLRQKGYKLRPIKMTERDSRQKDEVEKIRVPVSFSTQTSDDGFFSVSTPGKLYDFSGSYGLASQQQFADMSNGSYYMITRINTNSSVLGHSPDMVMRKIDSVIYESIPGKILTKQPIARNGYKGMEVVNRTRRGDYQRYNIFVTPFEIIIFKMSGNGDYVKEGKEADQFFGSITLNEPKQQWQTWTPPLGGQGIQHALLPALDFMVIDQNDEPPVEEIRSKLHRVLSGFPSQKLFITQGYICRNAKGEVDNLKRGGSDYSASLIAAAINAEVCEIWTDINGMHNNDPRVVDKTRAIEQLSFDEAAELAYFGAKILHPASIWPAQHYKVPVKLLNTMEPQAAGTLISEQTPHRGVKAVAAKDGITAVNIKSSRMLLAYGFLRKVFEVFEKYKTAIDMVTTSEVAVSVTIDNDSSLGIIQKELSGFSNVSVDHEQAIVSIVGHEVATQSDTLKKVFDCLHDVDIRMISYGGSIHNISILVKASDKRRVLQKLNSGLFGL